MTPDARLADLGLGLPPLRPKAGNYVGWRRVGALLFLSGQGADGWTGRVGSDLALDQARTAARDCGLNLLAQTRAALGSLAAVETIVKVTGFVACTPAFTQVPEVIDGASDLFIEIFGEAGRHARSAIGVQQLPKGFAVEIEMVVAVREHAAGRYLHEV